MLTDEEKKQFDAIKNEDPTDEPKDEPKDPPDEEPKDEPKDEPAPEPKDEPKEKKTVPLEALHEERSKRKEMQKRLDEMNEKFARADERMKVLFNRETIEPKAPDPNEDPIGHQAWRAEKLERQLEAKSKASEESSNNLKQELEVLKLKQYIAQQETVWERSNPDYQHALDFYVKARMGMLEDLGMEADEASQTINKDLSQIVNLAIDKGKNPAEAIHNMSRKMGFKKPDDPKKLENIEKGMKASNPAGSSPGKSNAPITAETLAEMSDEEFHKLKYSDLRKIMGA